MITLTKAWGVPNANILGFSGKSTDVKPIGKYEGMSITNGSEYKEIDTGNTYSYDAEGSSWYLNNTTTSGGGSGANGITPHIGENGNWFIGSTDTGVSAEGENGGYYIPAVTQPSSDKLQISFAPSKSDMPAVNPVTVNLPVSENSGQNPGQGGLTTAQINALHGMFKVCLFDDSKDVSGAISAFEAAFGITGGGEVPEEPDEPDVPVVPTYTVAYELVNVSSDNRASTVAEGAAYTAILTASDGYTMDGATVSVTMGGADITADVYADGVISIPAVAGNVSIMASAQVVEAEPELITDGLMAFWDFRQEKEPVVQAWHWAYPADVGDGGLYASIQGGSNGSASMPTFGEQGTTSSFHIMRDSTTYPADVEIASEFTVVALSYGGMTGSHYIASTNIDPRWAFSAKYYTADGTKKTLDPVGPGNNDDQTGYNFVVIRLSGNTAEVIGNTSAHTFNGDDYADFDHWTRFAKVGALNNGVNVAYAVYNRALTDVEIENMRAFYKTMEVRA